MAGTIPVISVRSSYLTDTVVNLVIKLETECNVCGGNIAVPGDVIKGEILSCPDCGLDYEIHEINSSTISLIAAEEIKEDWGE